MVTSSTLFQGLTKDFQDVTLKLGQLIQEQDTVVGQRDFAGTGVGTASHQPDSMSTK